MVGRVELKDVAVLINVVEGRAESARHPRRRLRVAPTGRALGPLPGGVLVLEGDLRHVLQRQASLEGNILVIKGQGITCQWVIRPHGGIESPIAIVPGAVFSIGKPRVPKFLFRYTQA